ncbi:BrnT family toxin [candidate division KSB1 bacterium]|nr:BrnT family toxin [candidate division KSB1 bacterium]
MNKITFQIGDFLFSWDARKSRANYKKHGVMFDEAATCWLDEYAKETYDEEHSQNEIRWLMIGRSDLDRLLICWYAERRIGQQQVIRLIGARLATLKEKEMYYGNT